MNFEIKVAAIKDTWVSPDGKVTIYTIVTEDAKELKTMSKQIADIGWAGTVEQYTNAKGNTYIRQPQKEGFDYAKNNPEPNIVELSDKVRLDRIEKKLDSLLDYLIKEPANSRDIEERGDDSGKDEVKLDDDVSLEDIPF